MTTRYEYNAGQWIFFHWLRKDWKMPMCDVPKGMRALDRSRVIETKEAPWGMDDPKTLDLANDRVGLPHPWKPGGVFGGRYMQRANQDARAHWTIRDSYGPHFPAHLPKSKTGEYWVENNPIPLWIPPFWGMVFSNHYDRHVILVDENESWEVIGASNFNGWAASGYGHYINNELQEGRHVTWGNRGSMASRMLNRNENDHLVSISIRGSDNDRPHFPWRSQRLALNLEKAPAALNDEQEALLNQLAIYGVSVDDHGGGTGLSWAGGAQWNNTTLHQLDLRLWMFDEVTDWEGKE